MTRWLNEPLLHFLVVGAALFGLYAALGARTGDTGAGGAIVVTQGRMRSLAETFARQWNRSPSEDELAGVVRDFVREDVLAREATALGLDRDDTIVRRRLAQKMEFLLEDVAGMPEPADEELAAFLAAHPDRFRIDSRATFSHVFVDRARRGSAFEADVAKLLATLNAPGDVRGLALPGDSRMLETRFEDVSRRDVEAQFGPGFAARLEELQVGRFEGPVESGYGAHLVRVESRTSGRVPQLEEVRGAVAREWSAAKRLEVKEAQLHELLARYTVTVEDGAAREPDRIAAANR
jgi:hypothetical protein